MTAKKTKPQVGVLSTNNLKVFVKQGEHIVEVDFKKDYDVPLLKKIMGYALNAVRTHGVGLNTWSHVEIDVCKEGLDSTEVDVYFMSDSKHSKVDVLGITMELNDQGKSTISGFYCIAVQPKQPTT